MSLTDPTTLTEVEEQIAVAEANISRLLQAGLRLHTDAGISGAAALKWLKRHGMTDGDARKRIVGVLRERQQAPREDGLHPDDLGVLARVAAGEFWMQSPARNFNGTSGPDGPTVLYLEARALERLRKAGYATLDYWEHYEAAQPWPQRFRATEAGLKVIADTQAVTT
jgi:hypothetical protein